MRPILVSQSPEKSAFLAEKADGSARQPLHSHWLPLAALLRPVKALPVSLNSRVASTLTWFST